MDKLIMNEKERKQLIVFERLKNGEITKTQAAERLKITDRWVRIKYNRYMNEGDRGLIHKNRSKPSPHKLKEEEVAWFSKLLKNEWKSL